MLLILVATLYKFNTEKHYRQISTSNPGEDRQIFIRPINPQSITSRQRTGLITVRASPR